MPPKFEPSDPGELFFGLNDLATRVRTLGPEERNEWIRIGSYIDDYIEYLGTLTVGKGVAGRPLTGGVEQGVMVALHSLEMARRSAKKQISNSTAAAIERASQAIRCAGDISLPSFAAGQ